MKSPYRVSDPRPQGDMNWLVVGAHVVWGIFISAIFSAVLAFVLAFSDASSGHRGLLWLAGAGFSPALGYFGMQWRTWAKANPLRRRP